MGLRQAIEMMGRFRACASPSAGFLPLPEATPVQAAQNFGDGGTAC
jgi:hypothetical protein